MYKVFPFNLYSTECHIIINYNYVMNLSCVLQNVDTGHWSFMAICIRYKFSYYHGLARLLPKRAVSFRIR